jgi:O-antigen ligase
MSKKPKQKLNKQTNEKLLSRLRTILLAALIIIVFYPPYLQGLFFEKHFLPTQIFVFAVFIVFLIYKWMKKDHKFFKTPIDYIAIGFVLVYFISIFAAVHTRSAIIEWMKYLMYFAVFYMLSSLADNLKTKFIILWTIVASAAGSSILGIDSAMGGNLVGFLNNIFKNFGAKTDVFFGLFVGSRVHSTLQYPNAMASYVMAVFFIAAGLLIISKKIWQKALLGGSCFILFLTLMLTKSRGVQLLFPVILVIFFLVIPEGSRIKSVTQVILLAVPAAVISLLINPYLSADELNTKALLLVLAGALISVIFGIISEYIGSFLQKVNWKVYAVVFSAFAVITIAAVIHIVNASVPLELSHDAAEGNRTITRSKDIALKPNKEYILSYKADARMEQEQNYAYFVRIFSLDKNNILFGGSTQLLRENLMNTNGMEDNSIRFTTSENNELTRISFSIYYTGTNVKVDDVKIIDAETGKVVKKVIFKNKYNLDSIISRFENMGLSKSLISRLIFYKDGMKIFGRSWLLGSGGGAWDYLYRQYQSYRYSSSQAHNFPLQLGIETGILGILVLLSLAFSLVFISIKYIKKVNSEVNSKSTKEENNDSVFINSAVIAAIAALLIHSVMDFDFSEAAMLLLFWQLIALFSIETKEKLTLQQMIPFNLKQKMAKSRDNKAETKGKALTAAAMVISVTACIFSLNFNTASAHVQKAYEYVKDNNIDEAIESINKAINLDGYNEKYITGFMPVPARPDIKTGLADLLFAKNDILRQKEQTGEKIPESEMQVLQRQLSQVNNNIMKLEKKAENNLSLSSNIASFCFRTGQTDKGLEYLNNSISLFPFEPSLWHSKIDVYYQLMRKHFNDEDYENTMKYIESAFSAIDEAKETNKKNMNPFIFNADTIELLEKMQFINDYIDNPDELKSINEIVHYTIPYTDVNLDTIPDQWRISDTALLKAAVSDEGIKIKATGRAYIYTQYHPKFKQGKAYRIEVQLKEPVDYLAYFIYGIKDRTELKKEENKYVAEFLVKNEPDENENQLRIYVESDCTIENILIKELTE